jgi:hypothetical protein
MGYTHYWDLNGQVTNKQKEQMKTAVWELNLLLDRLPKHSTSAGAYYEEEVLRICGGDGTGKAVITDEFINFNGDASKSTDYESFYFNINNAEPAFCKTARLPYDFVVCLTLLCLANNIEGFKFGSDGGLDDWKPAVDFYLDKTAREISANLKESVLGVLGAYDRTEIVVKN